MKLLIVEDSRFFRLSMERALSRAGYEVVAAGDGDQALQMARREQPDGILLDLLLPKTTGLEVLKALKRDVQTKQIPVIILTGLSPKNAAKLEKDGAAAYLEKSELMFNHQSGATSNLLTTVESVLHPRSSSGSNPAAEVKQG